MLQYCIIIFNIIIIVLLLLSTPPATGSRKNSKTSAPRYIFIYFLLLFVFIGTVFATGSGAIFRRAAPHPRIFENTKALVSLPFQIF
jgi:hypothetical protein